MSGAGGGAPGTPMPKNRRGDIHSSLRVTPRASARRPAQQDGNLNSDGTHLSMPPSSATNGTAQQLSAAPPTSEPDEIRAIWGTNVNLQQTMHLFRDFLRGFKPKYRIAHDRAKGLPTRPLASPEEGEHLLYETYLRRMRQTGQTNLNVDMINVLSWRSHESATLHRNVWLSSRYFLAMLVPA